MTIQVGANTVQHFARELIFLPFLCVKCQNIFAHQIDAFAFELFQILLEEVLETLIEFKANELSASWNGLLSRLWWSSSRATIRLVGVSSLNGIGLLMDTCAIVIDVSAQSGKIFYDKESHRTKEKPLTCTTACNDLRTSFPRACKSVEFPPPDPPISPRDWYFSILNYYWKLALLVPWPCHFFDDGRESENYFFAYVYLSLSLSLSSDSFLRLIWQ